MHAWRTIVRRDASTGTSPGQGAPPADDTRAVAAIYGVWLIAFLFKHAGAAWDIAWHFRYLRDDFAPPHLLNTIGTLIAFDLLVVQSWTGRAVEIVGLRLLQAGWIIFLVGIPLDALNHRLYGLDMTTWSATHMLLYCGTTLMLVGVLRSWYRLARPGPAASAYALAIWVLLLDDVLFPLGQQEYGVRAVADYLAGRTTADPELVALAGAEVSRFAYTAIPAWVYPSWLVGMGSLLLIAARRIHGLRWTATTVAAVYLALRLIAYAVFIAGGYSPSFVPVMLLGPAAVIDVAAHRGWQPAPTVVALLAAAYGGAAVVGRFTLMPAFEAWTAPLVGAFLWGALSARERGWLRVPQPARMPRQAR